MGSPGSQPLGLPVPFVSRQVVSVPLGLSTLGPCGYWGPAVFLAGRLVWVGVSGRGDPAPDLFHMAVWVLFSNILLLLFSQFVSFLI